MRENKEKNFISAVVYIHNNEHQLPFFLNQLNETLQKNFEKYEIVCVNDDSTDGSVDIIREFSKNANNVITIINMSFYQGIELAMNAGIDLAIGDFVFEFDYVYMDYELTTLMKVYQRALAGFDIVAAAPATVRKNSSRLFYLVFNHFADQHYKLRTESFRILSRRVINRVYSMSKTIPYRKAIYANCGLKIDRIIYANTRRENTRMDDDTADKRKDVALDSLVLFTDIAYRLAFGMTLLLMFISFLIAVYTIVVFFENQPVAGWTTTMLFLAMGFFGVFGVLAIIIKYLAVLVDLVFKKKTYITESIEKLTK